MKIRHFLRTATLFFTGGLCACLAQYPGCVQDCLSLPSLSLNSTGYPACDEDYPELEADGGGSGDINIGDYNVSYDFDVTATGPSFDQDTDLSAITNGACGAYWGLGGLAFTAEIIYCPAYVYTGSSTTTCIDDEEDGPNAFVWWHRGYVVGNPGEIDLDGASFKYNSPVCINPSDITDYSTVNLTEEQCNACPSQDNCDGDGGGTAQDFCTYYLNDGCPAGDFDPFGLCCYPD